MIDLTAPPRTRLGPWGGFTPAKGSSGGFAAGQKPRAFLGRVTRLATWGGPTRPKHSRGGRSHVVRAKHRHVRTSLAPWGGFRPIRGSRGGVQFLEQRVVEELMLVRSELDGSPGEISDGLVRFSGFCWFVGAGVWEPQRFVPSLATEGSAVTIAIKHWMGLNAVDLGVPQLAQPQQLIGLPGADAVGATPTGISVAIADPTAASPTVVLFDGLSALGNLLTIANEPGMFFLEFENIGGVIHVSARFNSSIRTPVPTAISPDTSFERIVFGDVNNSDGGFAQVALWNRKLDEQF